MAERREASRGQARHDAGQLLEARAPAPQAIEEVIEATAAALTDGMAELAATPVGGIYVNREGTGRQSFDGDYNRFGGKDLLDGVNLSIWALSANAVLAPAMSPIYGIGGVGFYSQGVSGDGIESESETDLGFNIGGGFKLPLTGFTTFVEARYHHVMTKDDNEPGSVNTKFLPIVFGIQF